MELFGSDVTTLWLEERQFVFRYRSAEDWLDAFRNYYGPTVKAFAALETSEQIAFEHDLIAARQPTQHLHDRRVTRSEHLRRGRRGQTPLRHSFSFSV